MKSTTAFQSPATAQHTGVVPFGVGTLALAIAFAVLSLLTYSS
jgi:hypothetical protein